jgi:aspartate aminotransferase-like enzyme
MADNTPSTVLIVQPPSTDGSENVALTEALRRIAELESKLASTQATAETALTAAVSAEIATMEEPEPIAETVTTMEVPESSDDGPKSEVPEQSKKGWWHHWI